MKNYNVKDMVSNNKQVHFSHYKQGELWYVTDCGFEFPVPIDDTGDASFMKQDRAMLFMRWINRHIKNINAGMEECQSA